MNYIKQINSFWEKAEGYGGLKPSAIAVYMALFQINNKCGWKELFKVDYNQVLQMTGLTKNTYYTALQSLETSGFIVYQPGPNQYQAAVFNLPLLYQNLGKQEERTGKAGGTHRERTGNIPKQVNNKTIKQVNFVDAAAYAREAKIKNDINEFTVPGHLEFEKEKNVPPKKEKEAVQASSQPTPEDKQQETVKPERRPLPTYREALQQEKLTGSAMWRNVLEHHGVDETVREAKFKIFYEQNEDCYLIMMPTWTDMAKHFYNWLPIHLNKGKLKQLMQITNGKFNTKPSGANGSRIAANDSLDELADRSRQFLQKSAGENYYGDLRE